MIGVCNFFQRNSVCDQAFGIQASSHNVVDQAGQEAFHGSLVGPDRDAFIQHVADGNKIPGRTIHTHY